ncbi:uncharacterized protein [Phaseolus vulgaris]|uniref:uncharacterized protein n=1 Tax=Phaseolus vulgaris TaxID=3885 RepID=UPI0035CA7996
MAAVEPEKRISLKLMALKEQSKVIFAEARKDFVDVLVENLPKECLRTDMCEDMLLRPRNSMEAYCRNLKINIDDTEPTQTVLTDLFLGKLRRDILHESGRITSWNLKANNSDEIEVKIVLRKSNGKILLAEGKADFADLIFSLLTIPLGGALQLMVGCSYVGSVDGLYKSVVDLDEHYFTTKEVKYKFVDPLLAPQFKLSNLLPLSCYNFPNYYYLSCNRSKIENYCLTTRYILPTSSTSCVSSVYVDPLSDPINNGEGYIKGPTTYIATDDLVVTPSSPISVMSLLSGMSFPVDDLEEKVGVRILQASLISTSALTLGLSHLLTKVKEN